MSKAIFQCQLYYTSDIDPKDTERDAIFTYYAESELRAVENAGAIWFNRNDAMPEHFTSVCRMKVWKHAVFSVSTEGFCPTAGALIIFDWKLGRGATDLIEAIELFRLKPGVSDEVSTDDRPDAHMR